MFPRAASFFVADVHYNHFQALLGQCCRQRVDVIGHATDHWNEVVCYKQDSIHDGVLVRVALHVEDNIVDDLVCTNKPIELN